MSDQIFETVGKAALLGWVILILLPRRWEPLNWLPRYIIPMGLSLVYLVLALPGFFAVDGGGYGSLDEISALFSSRDMLLAGWVHYLAFDLFIGAWIARQADTAAMSRVFQAPILLSTFLFGPVGLALFLMTRGLQISQFPSQKDTP